MILLYKPKELLLERRNLLFYEILIAGCTTKMVCGHPVFSLLLDDAGDEGRWQ